MCLPAYLGENLTRIVDLPDQQIALWNRSYDRYRLKFSPVDKIYDLYPDRNLQRLEVTEIMRRDPYLGFVAAMMWGGMNATRPETRSATDTPFRRLLETPQSVVEQAIEFARTQVREQNLRDLFLGFSARGSHKIPGVGHAYFTKLFFFLGQIEPVALKPLILDKWTSNAHCALLIQCLADNAQLPYLGVNRHYRHSVILPQSEEIKATLYEQYVRNFHDWATRANELVVGTNISAAKLEEFVFGTSLKRDPNANNPRLELWKIVESHFGVAQRLIQNRKRESKYQPLHEYFLKCKHQSVREVSLTIEEIEKILSPGSPVTLPNWAFTRSQGFWANSGADEHVHKKAWLSNGYFVDTVNISEATRSGNVGFCNEYPQMPGR